MVKIGENSERMLSDHNPAEGYPFSLSGDRITAARWIGPAPHVARFLAVGKRLDLWVSRSAVHRESVDQRESAVTRELTVWTSQSSTNIESAVPIVVDLTLLAEYVQSSACYINTYDPFTFQTIITYSLLTKLAKLKANNFKYLSSTWTS